MIANHIDALLIVGAGQHNHHGLPDRRPAPDRAELVKKCGEPPAVPCADGTDEAARSGCAPQL